MACSALNVHQANVSLITRLSGKVCVCGLLQVAWSDQPDIGVLRGWALQPRFGSDNIGLILG